MVKKKCLVLLSGGIDSAVVLSWAHKKGWAIAALSFMFPGRRKREILAQKNLCKFYKINEVHTFSIPFLDPPKANKACYIPKRNLMFYGVAASLAEKINADTILGGHFTHDGVVFPDARKSYLQAIDRLVQVSGRFGRKLKLVFPFINMSKKDIIKTGKRLNTPFQLSWSCSHDRARHCGQCNSCKERKDGFNRAKVEDPLFSKQ